MCCIRRRAERVIAAQRWRVRTASPLFDALFAMAQEDLTGIPSTPSPTRRSTTVGPFLAGVSSRARSGRSCGPATCPTPSTSACGASTRHARAPPSSSRSRRRVRVRHSSGLYVMQDTGSGGSWPISTDRVVWFLGARHLLDGSRLCRYRISGAYRHPRPGPALRLRSTDRAVPRGNVVPRLARADLSRLDRAQRRIHRAIVRAVDQRPALPGFAACRRNGGAARPIRYCRRVTRGRRSR